MALYTEIYQLALEDAVLKSRVTVACLIAAEAIRNEAPATPNHDQRVIWAKSAYGDPQGAGSKMLLAVLAQNAALTKAQIQSANDAAILTAVNNAVNVFATAP